MEKLDEDDLEAIRRQRLANLEKAQVQRENGSSKDMGNIRKSQRKRSSLTLPKL
ncbi:Thioredoxin domain-containing protein 9 [Caligus rogercresseyi]|uniref:Thioredoxin domain-containing protein 9 n=1 Tax=Caligus rogercresseyi TaxID=217165 RepID=A0A7T8KJG0_CALRO|nr:Thioredoxin domain-containing protein 9 [Caligus rogercresseyi]